MFNKKINKITFSLFAFSLLISQPSEANTYKAGTFTVTPLNINIAKFNSGFANADTKITTTTLTNAVVSRGEDAFRSRFSAGFHESDRNGYGYGAEASYFICDGTSILLRAGVSHEKGVNKLVVVERSFDFDSRTNYGAGIGIRQFFDMGEKWRPFASAVVSFTRQGQLSAQVFEHDSTGFLRNDTLIGKYTFGKKKTLLVMELNVGTEYLLTEHCALRFEVGLRYSQRAGGSTVNTPGVARAARPLTLRDNKNKWNVPVNFGISFVF